MDLYSDSGMTRWGQFYGRDDGRRKHSVRRTGQQTLSGRWDGSSVMQILYDAIVEVSTIGGSPAVNHRVFSLVGPRLTLISNRIT